MTSAPTLRFERELLRSRCVRLGSVDEVGRGALAGPVSVGVVVIDAATKAAPSGVRDSKLLSAAARLDLEPRIRRWAKDTAVGHASNAEIDDIGIIAALRLAASRAFAALTGPAPDLVLLDGSHDWLTTAPDLFAADDEWVPPPVVTRVKADLSCASVAAASVLAKVQRDGLMSEVHHQHPEYEWARNKGYSAPAHLEALTRLGPTPHHRVSWRLPELLDTEAVLD